MSNVNSTVYTTQRTVNMYLKIVIPTLGRYTYGEEKKYINENHSHNEFK